MWNSLFLMPAVACLLTPWPCSAAATSAELQSANTGQFKRDSHMTTETAKFFPDQNSKRVKISYGPFTVGPVSVNNGMQRYARTGIQMPCTDCLITWMQAGLEYPNGTVANANTNLWLHHTVFTNMQRDSAVCPGSSSGDDFFASGNERTPVDICVNGTDLAGYYLSPQDSLAFSIELMNMEQNPQDGVLTMTFEYIPSVPAGFDKVTALWFDIGGCNGSSELPAKKPAFSYTSPSWKSDLTGRVTFVGGHLHDGGAHLTVKKNGTVECDAVAAYGQNPAYIDPGMSTSSMSGMSMSSMSGMSMTMKPRAATSMTMSMSSTDTSSTTMSMASSMAMSSESTTPDSTKTSMAMSTSTSMSSMGDMVHISSISTCENFAQVNVDDDWSITAYYDPAQHALMTNSDGSLVPIMGIAILYVAGNNMTSTAAAASSSSSSATSGASKGFGPSVMNVIHGVGLAAAVSLIL